MAQLSQCLPSPTELSTATRGRLARDADGFCVPDVSWLRAYTEATLAKRRAAGHSNPPRLSSAALSMMLTVKLFDAHRTCLNNFFVSGLAPDVRTGLVAAIEDCIRRVAKMDTFTAPRVQGSWHVDSYVTPNAAHNPPSDPYEWGGGLTIEHHIEYTYPDGTRSSGEPYTAFYTVRGQALLNTKSGEWKWLREPAELSDISDEEYFEIGSSDEEDRELDGGLDFQAPVTTEAGSEHDLDEQTLVNTSCSDIVRLKDARRISNEKAAL